MTPAIGVETMQDRPGRRATYEDVLATPAHLVADLLDGRLVTHPRPASRQSRAATILGGHASAAFDEGIGGPGGWRRERLPVFPDAAWFDLAPDWACEVLSPSTRRYDKGEKRDLCARQGIEHLWHVDTSERLLEVFQLTEGKWLLLRTFCDDEEVVAPPFAAVPFNLGRLWAD